MKVKPIASFQAVVPGSAYPQGFGPDDELEPASVAAKAALDLGLLSEKEAAAVRKAHEAENPSSSEEKSQGAAPENKGAKA